MAEPPRDPEAGTPGWVKVFGVVAVLVVVAFVVLLLMGGHGPARHALGESRLDSSARTQLAMTAA